MRVLNCAALFGVLFLAACQTMTPEQLAISDTATCQQYGFKPDTDAFAQCRLQMSQQHHVDDVRQRQAISAALTKMSDDMARNRPVTCNSNTSGTAYGFGRGANYNQNTSTTCY
jgi:hypothetical protein